MLEALVIAGLVAAPLGSAALFLPARHHARAAGAWAATWRVILAVVGSAVLAAAAAGVLYLLKATEGNLILGGAAVALAGLLWLPVTRNWSPRAHLCWASSTYLFAVYLVYALEWTFASHLGPASTAGGVLLWCLEVVAALMSCAYLWELCDALGTAHWHRRRTRLTRAAECQPRRCGRRARRTRTLRLWSACTSRHTTSRGHGHRDAPRAAAP